MTNDYQLGHFFKDLLSIGSKKPFHIVLVDIKQAAEKKEIVCVEKPLEGNGEDLKYVALSYRWGELQETMVDTQVGYTGSVTSLNLEDFYQLCAAMILDSDLQTMDYVWVDAICVDQTNYERRKATIYQMTNIYEKASYILAVPDLHSTYLRNAMLKNKQIMQCSLLYGEYLYHLIHGNSDHLEVLDEDFLDECNIPNDRALRELLTKGTDHFTEAFMKYDPDKRRCQLENALNRICETDQSPRQSANDPNSDDSRPSKNDQIRITYWMNNGRHILTIDKSERKTVWKDMISKRSDSIRQSMEFLADLIMDWSTRVWVISEFSIARKKNNLKYWFLQLRPHDRHGRVRWSTACPFRISFFKYDFDRPIIENNKKSIELMDLEREVGDLHTVYIRFHCTWIQQLNDRTFLDMILKSKASKNEDRFYAVLPLSEYKNTLVTSKQEVGQWNINTTLSVKLKLYEIMNTKDKLNLLFWSGNSESSNVGLILPTFATSTLSSDVDTDDFTAHPCNFDLSNTSTLMLHQTTAGFKRMNESHQYYINLKPLEYYTATRLGLDFIQRDDAIYYSDKKVLEEKLPLYIRHQIIDPYVDMAMEDQVHVIAIPSYSSNYFTAYCDPVEDSCIFLIGNLSKNKWMFDHRSYLFKRNSPECWIHHYSDDYSAGFNIY
ncbi:hypothetical protein BCR42DRAFT_457590 [Absidia repens]|uniref:Heterokaryon incompatibility domain-containing protein n=1 Tax=Absidia repens TaxID=90262 RepID=A0A1X2HE23_9FUNG|nr:hypothetical protein BCR42DRAFT_457590 [Absidia repens]